eukprot:4984913-Pleurochrysis_carterae.AAC.1
MLLPSMLLARQCTRPVPSTAQVWATGCAQMSTTCASEPNTVFVARTGLASAATQTGSTLPCCPSRNIFTVRVSS